MEPAREWPLRERVFSFAVAGAVMGGIFGAFGLAAPDESYPARRILLYLILLGLGSGAGIGVILPDLDRLWKFGVTGGSVGPLVYGGIGVLSGDGVDRGLIWIGVAGGALVGLGLGLRFRGWASQAPE